MKHVLLFCSAVVMLMAVAREASADAIYVAPTGSDANAGTQSQPFATLQRAQQAVRQMRVKGQGTTVVLRGGTYYLPDTLVLTAQDSGTEQAPIVWRAAEGETPIISGGGKWSLTWSPYRGGIMQAKVPAEFKTDQLFVNGEPAVLARYPNFDAQARNFNGTAADSISRQRAARWADPKGGFIHSLHGAAWGSLHYQITGKDAAGNLTYEGGWQNNRPTGIHDSVRFVENIFEELDAPGEWFLNAKNKTLYFYPPVGLDLARATIETVRLRHLLECRGDAANPVRFVRFQGLTFRHAARTFMETREPLLRSDWRIYRGGAVFFTGVEDCTLDDCLLDQLGGNAVFVSNYARRIALRGCHFDNLGGSAVAFVGDPGAVRDARYDENLAALDKTAGPRTPNYPADCLVEDCLIHHIGRVEKQVAGVEIAMAQGITVRHCSIYDTPRAGINIGDGCWGGHVIEFCDVFDTVKETGDHGSFNSWGRDRWWNLGDFDPNACTQGANRNLPRLDAVRPTILRNSRWRCDSGWDIDLDDGSTNYEIRDNLCLKGGIKNREGFYRVVENNIMVGNSFHPHVWFKDSEDVFRHNIVFTAYQPIGVGQPWGREVDFNLLHKAGQSVATPAIVLQQQSGRDQHSLVADAMFLDPSEGDFRVKEGSPALKLGFKNFPMDQFGVRPAKLKALALTPEIPRLAGSAATASPSPTPAPASGVWLGVAIRDLQGEEYSVFGVPREAGGVNLPKVPAGTAAARAGFHDHDLIQAVDGKAVKSIAELFAAVGRAQGKRLSITVVRSQRKESVEVADYLWFSVARADRPEQLPVQPRAAGVLTLKFSARPSPNNGPAADLGDGRLVADFGPVFANGVSDGCYKADLGQSTEVGEVRAWSYRQASQRAPQRFMLYGSNAKEDPGWNTANRTRFTPIASVDTTGQPVDAWQVTTLRGAGAATLGSWRWLLWAVQPPNGFENTVYQEIEVVSKSAVNAGK